uniref:Uncharacterized protein n=1 Tax=Avena sativa TaxID=4498 RepID=A0ACD5XZE2_AVESA
MERMKRVWRVRGHTEAKQIEPDEGRKFIIEFSEEEDRRHAVRGGQWQYKMDAFLVEAMDVGADPALVPFTHVPMWVQFRGIPFYLLTKSLAWALGEEIGTTIMIDNNSRCSISDKFLRARVQLPLYAALRERIILADEITGEEVKVQICYERLPNFCLFCGYIGHMEARCDLPMVDRKIKFSQGMRVQPVYFDDLRAWFLPEAMGQAKPVPDAPWRATKPIPATAHQSVIAQVAEDVAKLTVNGHNKSPATIFVDRCEGSELPLAKTAIEAKVDKLGAVVEAITADNATDTDNLKTVHQGASQSSDASSNRKESKRWKRKNRGNLEVQSFTNTLSVPLERQEDNEANRVHPRDVAGEDNSEPAAKKGHFLVPPLSVCLGKEARRGYVSCGMLS